MKIIKKIMGAFCLIELIVSISLSFTVIKDEPISSFLLCAFFASLAYLLLKKPKSIQNSDTIDFNITEKENTIFQKENTFQSQTKTIQKRRSYYNVAQIPTLLQHIKDSYEIMNSTSNPETICYRYKFGLKKCCQLKDLEQNGLYYGNPDANYYLYLFSPDNYHNLILLCYDRYVEKARKELKTEKGINRRIDKFWNIIKENVDEFTYNKLREQINTKDIF